MIIDPAQPNRPQPENVAELLALFDVGHERQRGSLTWVEQHDLTTLNRFTKQTVNELTMRAVELGLIVQRQAFPCLHRRQVVFIFVLTPLGWEKRQEWCP